MQFIIVTGMSGAGKSTVLKFLEDLGFFCVDNLPPILLPKFAEICMKPGSDVNKAAFGIDIRGGNMFDDLFITLETLSDQGVNYRVLFLDSSDEVLLKRYKESRRNHPLAKSDRLITGIGKERLLLSEIKKQATHVIDTSFLLSRQLKEQIKEIFIEDKKFSNLMINIISFGFKYGIPGDSDLVFDVRFIPNPYYTELKHLTGNDLAVQNFVLECETSTVFLEKLIDMISFLLPNYISEGKNQLVVSIGCTGGKHRSVTLANELYKSLQGHGNWVIINHRDIEKDTKT